MRFFDNNRGFSLVELLGVVAIIGILASVVGFNVQAGKEKARDAQRLSDMQQIQIALRLFKDVHNRYPVSGDGDGVDDCKHNTSFLPGGCLEVLVTEGMLPSLPAEPSSGKLYRYSNWCRDPDIPNGHSDGDQYYRVWTWDAERYTGGTRYPCGVEPFDPDATGCWWDETVIGSVSANCLDPS